MKKKICIISVVILLAVLCWLPLPRRVACQSEAIQISGWYLDFLLIGDRFYGNTQINGNDFQPYTNHGAHKITMDGETIYGINVYRYRAESNDLDMRTIYLEEDLRTIRF